MIVRPTQEQRRDILLSRRLFWKKAAPRDFFGHAAAIQLKYARDNGKKQRAIETLVCFGNEKFIY